MIASLAVFSVAVIAQEKGETKKDGAERTKKEWRMGGERFKGEKGRYGKRGFRGGHGGMVRGLHKLELTEPQRSQIKTLMETQKNVQMPFHIEMRALKMKMRDGSATEGDRIRMKEMHTALKESNDQLRTSILGVLTPDQLQKLEQMKVEREQMMEQRRQKWFERKQQKTESTIKQDG